MPLAESEENSKGLIVNFQPIDAMEPDSPWRSLVVRLDGNEEGSSIMLR